MSTKERHELFKSKGWLYQGAIKMTPGPTFEIWYKDGETRIWKDGLPSDEPSRQESAPQSAPVSRVDPIEVGAIMISEHRVSLRYNGKKYSWYSDTLKGTLSDWAQRMVDDAVSDIRSYGYPATRYSFHFIVPEQNVVPVRFYTRINRCAARREALTFDFDRTCDEVRRILAINDRAFKVVKETPDWVIFGAPKK